MEDRKIYIVKLLEKNDHDPTPLKVFSSLLKAKNYCEEESRKLVYKPNEIEPRDYAAWWEDAFTYVVQDGTFEWLLQVECTSLDEDVAGISRPEVEVENEVLKKENLELREKLSKQAAMNAAAKAYLVMWDGGWKYSKEHVIENMHAAKACLEGNDEGDKALDDLVGRWTNVRNASSGSSINDVE